MANRDAIHNHIFKSLVNSYNKSPYKPLKEDFHENMKIKFSKEDLKSFELSFKVLKTGDLYPKVSYKLIEFNDKLYTVVLGLNRMHYTDDETLTVKRVGYLDLDKCLLAQILTECIHELSFIKTIAPNNIYDYLSGKDYITQYKNLLKDLEEIGMDKIIEEAIPFQNFKLDSEFKNNLKKLKSFFEDNGHTLTFLYKKHFLFEYELMDILRFFEDMDIFEIDPASVFIDDLHLYKSNNNDSHYLDNFCYKMLIYIFSQSESPFTLPFNISIKEKILELISNSGYIASSIYENLLNAILSVHWTNVYLCLYKEIEYTFPKYAYVDFQNKISQNIQEFQYFDLFELAGIIEKSIGTRPKEEDSFIKVIETLVKQELKNIGLSYDDVNLEIHDKEPTFLSNLYKIVRTDSHSPHIVIKNELKEDTTRYHISTKVQHTAKRLYKLRNKIVHSREALKQEDMNPHDYNNAQWNDLIYNLLLILEKVMK